MSLFRSDLRFLDWDKHVFAILFQYRASSVLVLYAVGGGRLVYSVDGARTVGALGFCGFSGFPISHSPTLRRTLSVLVKFSEGELCVACGSGELVGVTVPLVEVVLAGVRYMVRSGINRVLEG